MVKIQNLINIPFRLYKRYILFRRAKAFYKQFLEVNDLCFDIGANIGKKTKVFNAIGARTIVVEPQPHCISILQKKYNHNENVTIIEAGIGSKISEMEMEICDDRSAISSFSQNFTSYIKSNYPSLNWNKTIKVKILTLDQLIKEYGMPQFCKIDVEGYELEVFKGLSSPIPYISFEFNSPFVKDTYACLNELDKLGKFKFNISIGESMKFEFKKWVDKNDVINYFENLPDEFFSGDVYARSESNR